MIIIETEKLYSPLFCQLQDDYYDDYNDNYWGDPMSQEDAVHYENEIRAALLRERMPDEEPRGLMTYYHEVDSVNDKVHSLHMDVEVHDDKLWGVATITLTEPLTPEELDTLREYISGQYSDGFGEGFEQRGIAVSVGKLYVHLWDYDREGGFFIDTEREFRQRLGLEPLEAETPAQAALHELDIYDDEATAALREQLINRLDTNLGDYFNSLHGMNGKEIASFSSEIAVTTDAHCYLTEMHNFHTSELEYLLKFQNPLEVVADAFDVAGVHDRTDIMWNIFDRQDAFQGDYPLMPDPAGEDALKQKLFDRLDRNLSDNMAHLHGLMTEPALSREDVLRISKQIVANCDAHHYLTTDYEFRNGDIENMLRLQNPLYPIADDWVIPTNVVVVMDAIVHDVLDNMDARQDLPVAAGVPPVKDDRRKPSAEKPSILDRIREAAKAPKEPHKDKPQRDKSEPEI